MDEGGGGPPHLTPAPGPRAGVDVLVRGKGTMRRPEGGGIRGSTQRPGDEPGDETGGDRGVKAQTWECQLLDSSPCATHVFQHLLFHYAPPLRH